MEIVDKWFKAGGSQLSWRGLCTALRHPLVGRPDIAMNIEAKIS